MRDKTEKKDAYEKDGAEEYYKADMKISMKEVPHITMALKEIFEGLDIYLMIMKGGTI